MADVATDLATRIPHLGVICFLLKILSKAQCSLPVLKELSEFQLSQLIWEEKSHRLMYYDFCLVKHLKKLDLWFVINTEPKAY